MRSRKFIILQHQSFNIALVAASAALSPFVDAKNAPMSAGEDPIYHITMPRHRITT
jgi:hypothetical protein